MGFLTNLFSDIVSVGASIVGVAINLVSEFKERVKETVYNLQTNHEQLKKEIDKEYLNISDVNDEIFEYREKYKKDNGLNNTDKEHVKNLQKKRLKISDSINSIKKATIVTDLANDSDAYKNVTVQDYNLHILQYQVGKSVIGKTCNKCGRPLLLQWKSNQKVKSLSDFFWGCSGYYFNRICTNTDFFTLKDYNLLANQNVAEFSITNNEFNNIIDYGNSSKIINNRFGSIINQKIDDYLCPVHNEPLVLKEKKESIGLLDNYFLSCPRWLPKHQGCNYIVKLKSPAQLASVLEKQTGRGII